MSLHYRKIFQSWKKERFMVNDLIINKLKAIEEDCIRRKIPIIGSKKGEWLLGKVKELNPKYILELGTAVGYSGVILGSEGGNLITIEKDRKAAEEAGKNFEKFGIKADIIIGDGADEIHGIVEKAVHSFDMIFVDFAKKKYVDILE